jgi:hypothetical protein
VYAKQKMSSLRWRSLFFPCLLSLIFFFASVFPAHADSLEDAARALARKVNSSSKEFDGGYGWQNRSSVSSATSERLRAAFQAELERLHSRLDPESEGRLEILITEGPTHLHLIAVRTEDSNGNEGKEFIGSVTFSKGQFALSEHAGTVLRLDRQLLWQEPQPMLDLAQSNDPTGKPDVMLVLGRESISLYRWDDEKWQHKDSIPLPRLKVPQRDLRGEIHLYDHYFQFHLPGIECDGDAWQKLAFECDEETGIWSAEIRTGYPFSLDGGHSFFSVNPHYTGPKKFPLSGFFSAAELHSDDEDFEYRTAIAGMDGHAYVFSSGNENHKIPEALERLPLDLGSEIASAECQGRSIVFATGTKDGSLQDTLQGFDVEPKAATPVTAAVEFLGPILSLKAVDNRDNAELAAIVFNLTTGNYEAYRITVACGE